MPVVKRKKVVKKPKKKTNSTANSVPSTLLARCVDASLSNNGWLKLAKWLEPCVKLKCFPAGMLYGFHTCASKALAIYLGQAVPTLPSKPTIETVINTARTYGSALDLLYDVDNSAKAERCLLFGTMPAVGGSDKSGGRGCLIPIKNNGTGSTTAIMEHMRQLLASGVRKMTLTIFNETLFPCGHCTILKKIKERWYLSDPHLPPGMVLKVPSEEAVILLMCGATTIIGE